uniref:Conserved oligomeric Golgi complex subunit 3 n=1 Tax=Romanomermis culicivorax TaxID=13658 RepID=A0A915HWH8_ROMCU
MEDKDINPSPSDCLRILIYVELIGSKTPIFKAYFNQILKFLNDSFDELNVINEETPPRRVFFNFINELNESKLAWGEFQYFRRPVALIGFYFRTENSCSDETEIEEPQMIFDEFNTFSKTISANFSSLLESRLVMFDINNGNSDTRKTSNIGSKNFLHFDVEQLSPEYLDNFNESTIDFLNGLFWILEGKRRNSSAFDCQSGENLPLCPMVPDEEKFFVGLDKNSRLFRKRCTGRLKMQLAHLTLQSGLPLNALDIFSSAIEILKSSNDFLWLAGAYEGYVSALLIMRYCKRKPNRRVSIDRPSDQSQLVNGGLRRVATFSSPVMEFDQNLLPVSNVHSNTNKITRTKSSLCDIESVAKLDDSLAENSVPPNRKLLSSSSEHRNGSLSPRRSNYQSKVLNLTNSRQKFYSGLRIEDLEEKTKLALENYRKFSIAAGVECECALRLSTLYIEEKDYLRLDSFLRENCCTRFLTEDCRQFDDLRKIYPTLLNSMDSYLHPCRKIHKDCTKKLACPQGWPAVRIRAFHELFVAAQRAQYFDAAVRLFEVLPLPAYLTPRSIENNDLDSIFIYTPLTNSSEIDNRPLWVADCTGAVEITLMARCNGIPFEAVPTEIILPPFNETCAKLIITPKSEGVLTITGYTCEVMNVVTVCDLRDIEWLSSEDKRMYKESPSSSKRFRKYDYKIRVVEHLPELSFDFSTLPRIRDFSVEFHSTEVYATEIELCAGQSTSYDITVMNESDMLIDEVSCEVSGLIVSDLLLSGQISISCFQDLQNGSRLAADQILWIGAKEFSFSMALLSSIMWQLSPEQSKIVEDLKEFDEKFLDDLVKAADMGAMSNDNSGANSVVEVKVSKHVRIFTTYTLNYLQDMKQEKNNNCTEMGGMALSSLVAIDDSESTIIPEKQMVEQKTLISYENEANKLLSELEASRQFLLDLVQKYEGVSHKTSSLHEACDKLMSDQTALTTVAEEMRHRLTYFDRIDQISQKLQSPLLSVTGESFMQILISIDETITFLNNNTTESAKVDDTFTLFYGLFGTHAPNIKSLMENLEKKRNDSEEYASLLDDCYGYYFEKREQLISPSVRTSIEQLRKAHSGSCLLHKIDISK